MSIENEEGASGVQAGEAASSAPAASAAEDSAASEQSDAGSESASGDASEAGEGTEAAAAVPAYTPNFKYKVLGQEQELPENVRGFIKDEETEKYFRSLHERAGAVEHFSTKNKTLGEQLDTYKQHYSQLAEPVKIVQESIKAKDYETAIEMLNIPMNELIDFAAKQLQMRENPQQFQQHQMQRQMERQQKQMQEQQRQALSQADDRNVNYIRREFESMISRPDNAAFEKEFDKRAGRVGAFRDEIIYRGDFALARGELKTTTQIAEELKAMFASQSAGSTNPTAGAPTSASGTAAKKTIVPVIPGSGGSPVVKKSTPNSLAELAAMRAKM